MSAEVPKFSSFRKPSQKRCGNKEDDKPAQKAAIDNATAYIKKKRRISPPQSPIAKAVAARPKAEQYAGRSPTEFFVDRVGDRDIEAYGRNDKAETPAYRSTNEHRPLGIERTARNPSAEKSPLSNLTGTERFQLLHDKATPKICPPSRSPYSIATKEESDYILLSGGEEEGKDCSNLDTTALQGEEHEEQNTERQCNSLEDGQEADVFGKQLRRRHSELEEKTRLTPTEVAAWLDLVDFQDEWVRLAFSPGHSIVGRLDKNAVLKAQFSVLADALKVVPQSSFDHSKLVRRRMEVGSTFWDAAVLAQEWERTIQTHPESDAIWSTYLDFKQRHAFNFNFQDCQSIFLHYFQSLRTRSPSLAVRLDALLRVGTFLRQGGFHEHAFALWQATFEVWLFRPQNLEHLESAPPRDVLLSEFEVFWDSEVPRVGEARSTGWCNSSLDDQISTGTTDKSAHSALQGSLASSWESTERFEATKSLLPGRTSDDVDAGDPFHVVFAADLLPFLVFEASNVFVPDLVNAFLCFCCLPPISRSQSRSPSQDSNQDFSLCDTCFHLEYEDLTAFSPSCLLQAHLHDCVLTDELLFDSAENLGQLDQWSLDRRKIPTGRATVFVLNVLEHVSTAVPQLPGLLDYVIGLKASMDPHKVRQYVKKMIRREPDNTRLYVLYAWLEKRCAGIAEADKFLVNAISAFYSSSPGVTSKTIGLWRTWVVQALLTDDEAKLRRCFACLGSGTCKDVLRTEWRPPDSASEQVQQVLVQGIESAQSDCVTEDLLSFAECLAIFSYFKEFKLVAMFQVVEDQSKLLERHRLECLHQTQAQLIVYHLKHHRVYQPSLLRHALRRSMASFPGNTLFATTFLETGPHLVLEDQLRPVFDGTLSSSSMNTMELCSLLVELKQDDNDRRVHTIRRKFEHICRQGKGRYSVLMWSCWLLYECKIGRLDIAKRTFHEGLGNLPWSKSFAMLAFTHLNTVMDEGKLDSIYNAMSERGLRIHVDRNDWQKH